MLNEFQNIFDIKLNEIYKNLVVIQRKIKAEQKITTTTNAQLLPNNQAAVPTVSQ